jgi:hypothetical protein
VVKRFTAALTGIKLLYSFDRRAWEHFDLSARGFWAAYIIPLILAPFEITHRLLAYTPETGGSLVTFVIREVLTYGLTWVLFPFAMLYLAPLLGRMPRYFAHMVPYLWMQLPMGLLLFGTRFLVDMGMLPETAGASMNLVVIAAYAVYGTFVAGIGLQVATGTALSLVVLDYVMGLLVYALIAKL